MFRSALYSSEGGREWLSATKPKYDAKSRQDPRSVAAMTPLSGLDSLRVRCSTTGSACPADHRRCRRSVERRTHVQVLVPTRLDASRAHFQGSAGLVGQT